MQRCEAAGLRREASLCRSLAAIDDDIAVADELTRMAAEFEARAEKLERGSAAALDGTPRRLGVRWLKRKLATV